jgi:peptide/nickel transport system permease protein
LQATDALASAGAGSPAEFYDEYTMDLEAEGPWSRARRRFVRHRLAVASLVVLSLLSIAGLLATHIAPYGYEQVSLDALSAGPSWSHPFGTDQIGRDYFSRTLLGLRTEVEIALVIGIVGTFLGTIIGAAAGYLGGFADLAVMRVADWLLTVPALVSVLVAAAFLKVNTLFEVCLLLGALLWMPVARVVRAATLVVREHEYVHAARAMGASDLRILRRHIVPNVIGSVAVAASVMAASAVIIETTLSYLGVGLAASFYGGRTDTRLFSVGDVLAAASNEGLFNWWGIVFPGVVVILLIAPIYFIGDGIRDALDPTQRRYVSERELARRRRPPSRLSRAVRAIPRPELNVRLRTPRRVSGLVEALPRLPHRSRPRLLVEAVAVLALTAAAAAGVYVWKVNPVRSSWALAGTAVQNVSRAYGAQTQVAAASDPAHPGTLLAASNDTSLRTVRVYTSHDAGRTWTSSPGPSLGLDACARGEPSVAVDPRGRQYVAFSVSGGCTQYDETPYVVVATRAAAAGAWSVRRLAPHRPEDFWDDHPSLAVSGNGRVYVAWSRLLRWTYEGVVVSSSGDGGRTWSQLHVVDRRLSYPRLPAVTVAPDGTLYVAGTDARFGVWLARSDNGGTSFRLERVAPLPYNRAAVCATAGQHPTPFQDIRCVGPNPSVVAMRDRVFVTYGVGWPGQPQSVRLGVFDPSFRRLWVGDVAPSRAQAERFWPASTTASGRLWVCFYDTSGDRGGKQAWYSCASSHDGREWNKPVRAAADSASPEVLWEDARIYAFGDELGYGGSTAVAATGGRIHPFWIDTRNLGGKRQEVFGATVP